MNEVYIIIIIIIIIIILWFIYTNVQRLKHWKETS